VEDYDGNVLEYAEGSFFETGMMTLIEEFEGVDIQVFPNPTNGTLKLRCQTPVTRHVSRVTSIGLFSVDGRLVKLIELDQVSGIFEKEVDISDLPQGLYFIKMQVGKEMVVRKLVVGGW
jgi:hypothetical protein